MCSLHVANTITDRLGKQNKKIQFSGFRLNRPQTDSDAFLTGNCFVSENDKCLPGRVAKQNRPGGRIKNFGRV